MFIGDNTHAKHKRVQKGSGVLCPQPGWQCHCRDSLGQKDGGNTGYKGRRGRGTLYPGAGRLQSIDSGGRIPDFEADSWVFGAVRFLVSSSPSAELHHVVDTTIVF